MTHKAVIERCVHRTRIEQRLTESIRSSHTDALSSAVPLNVDLGRPAPSSPPRWAPRSVGVTPGTRFRECADLAVKALVKGFRYQVTGKPIR